MAAGCPSSGPESAAGATTCASARRRRARLTAVRWAHRHSVGLRLALEMDGILREDPAKTLDPMDVIAAPVAGVGNLVERMVADRIVTMKEDMEKRIEDLSKRLLLVAGDSDVTQAENHSATARDLQEAAMADELSCGHRTILESHPAIAPDLQEAALDDEVLCGPRELEPNDSDESSDCKDVQLPACAAPVPRRGRNRFCKWCHAAGVNLEWCNKCGVLEYCSESCRAAHWPYHKDRCQSWRLEHSSGRWPFLRNVDVRHCVCCSRNSWWLAHGIGDG